MTEYLELPNGVTKQQMAEHLVLMREMAQTKAREAAFSGLPHLMGLTSNLHTLLHGSGYYKEAPDGDTLVVDHEKEPMVVCRIRRNLLSALDRMDNILTDDYLWKPHAGHRRNGKTGSPLGGGSPPEMPPSQGLSFFDDSGT